jgi:hypothetical protein
MWGLLRQTTVEEFNERGISMTPLLIVASAGSALEVVAVIAAAVIFLGMVVAGVAVVIWTAAGIGSAANHPPPSA